MDLAKLPKMYWTNLMKHHENTQIHNGMNSLQ